MAVPRRKGKSDPRRYRRVPAPGPRGNLSQRYGPGGPLYRGPLQPTRPPAPVRRPGRSVPLIPYDPAPSRKVPLQVARWLGFAAQRNPYVFFGRAALNLALDYWDWRYAQQPGQERGDLAKYGFIQCCGPSVSAEMYNTGVGGSTPCGVGYILCDLPFQVPRAPIGQTIEVRPGDQYVCIGPSQLDGHRFYIDEVWWRPLTDPLEIPWKLPPKPIFIPLPDPLADPYADPYAPPEPVIREVPAPYPTPGRGPRPAPRPKPYESPMIETEIRPSPGPARPPYSPDDPWQDYDPGAQPRPVPRPEPGLHPRLPPPPGDKERKRDIPRGLAGKLLAKLYDTVTEADDAIDEIYDALPKEKRCKGAKTPQAKVQCIYDNFEHLDLMKAAANLAYNHYEDKLYGRIYGPVGKYAPYGVMLSRPKAPYPRPLEDDY